MNEWTRIYDVRHSTLRVRCVWQLNGPYISVSDWITNDSLGMLPALLPPNPSIDDFIAYLEKVDWDAFLTNARSLPSPS